MTFAQRRNHLTTHARAHAHTHIYIVFLCCPGKALRWNFPENVVPSVKLWKYLIPNLTVVGTLVEVTVGSGVVLSVQRWRQDILFASYPSRLAVAPTQPPIQWVLASMQLLPPAF